MSAPRTMIRLEHVSIVFGNQPKSALPLMERRLDRREIERQTGQILGVHDCSLEVHEGEIAVLMGLSGSGKSTLLRAVNGLNTVTRGSVLVDDGTRLVDVARADKRTLRRLRTTRVSMVFQQFGLLPWRSVLENVALGLELAGLPAKARRERAMTHLEGVGLADWADRKVEELSGGMQQRVGLARAFATEAPILLMDEPFSALDPLIRAKLQDELLQLQQKLRCTILFVSHDLEEAVKLGNRISILEGGRIVQTGTPEEIVLKPVDAHVADFVARLNPLAVLKAKDIMQPGKAGMASSLAGSVRPLTPVRDMLPTLARHYPGTIAVIDRGAIIGTISPRDVLAALAR
jgi:glycine betaine/proline transport system ATP-binding protein